MRYLLDTNAISDARRGQYPTLDAWLADQPVSDLAVSVISMMELDIGVRRKERLAPHAGALLREWLDGVVEPLFRGRILPVDEHVRRAAAPLHVPDPMPAFDSLIAATALAHGLTLVSRNHRDVARTGVPLLTPWGD